MSQKTRILIVISAVSCVLAAVVIPNFIRARSATASNACINNLRQIESAKQQWALENMKTANDASTWNDIRPLLKQVPLCPMGGTYILGRLNELPKCSIGGRNHTLNPN